MTRLLLNILLAIVISNSETKEERILLELFERKEIIIQASQSVGISPRIVASIIYAERLRNFNWNDAILDDVLAKSGYNSSVGFAQLKVNTAIWIESEINTPHSKNYPGRHMQSLVTRSRSRTEIINRLTNDSLNILYCACYAAIIKNRWKESGFFFTDNNETGIIATVYSLGLISADGKERLPRRESAVNEFGRTAQHFFNSFLLIKEFSR